MRRCITVFFIGLVMSNSSASAGLTTSLNVAVTPSPGGFRYEYTLGNEASSDLPVVSFALSVAPESDLQSITGPLSWNAIYNAGDSIIAWESPDVLFDIQPGALGAFSFISALDPVPNDYLIVGLDEIIPRIEFNQGQIAGPGASVVPEPSTLTLLGIGVLGLLAYARRQHKSAGSNA